MKRLLCLVVFLAACGRREPDAAPDAGMAQAADHTIVLPHFEPELPPGRGRAELISSCVLCHSPQYITNQPRFSREVWDEEVHKMMKLYGAPVPAASVAPIVDYLVAFHGKEAP